MAILKFGVASNRLYLLTIKDTFSTSVKKATLENISALKTKGLRCCDLCALQMAKVELEYVRASQIYLHSTSPLLFIRLPGLGHASIRKSPNRAAGDDESLPQRRVRRSRARAVVRSSLL